MGHKKLVTTEQLSLHFIKRGKYFANLHKYEALLTGLFVSAAIREVDRLEELKMQNMKKVIEAISGGGSVQDKCFYSQEQRQASAAYYSSSYRSVTLHAAAHLCFTSADIH